MTVSKFTISSNRVWRSLHERRLEYSWSDSILANVRVPKTTIDDVRGEFLQAESLWMKKILVREREKQQLIHLRREFVKTLDISISRRSRINNRAISSPFILTSVSHGVSVFESGSSVSVHLSINIQWFWNTLYCLLTELFDTFITVTKGLSFRREVR